MRWLKNATIKNAKYLYTNASLHPLRCSKLILAIFGTTTKHILPKLCDFTLYVPIKKVH